MNTLLISELEPEYVAIANKRLEQVQGSLF